MTTISDQLVLVTATRRPICETTPWKASVNLRSTRFRAVFRARSSRTWSMREALPRQGFTQHIQAVGSVMPWRAADAQASATPPDCAVTAQIAHSKYATQYARLVRIQVRTGSSSRRGSHFWFATSYANLVRTRPAVTTLVTT